MFHKNPHGYLENLELEGFIAYTWNDIPVVSDDDSISYQLRRVYTVLVAGEFIQEQYTQPRRLSQYSVTQNKLVHPSLARAGHKEVIAKVLKRTLDAIKKASGVSND